MEAASSPPPNSTPDEVQAWNHMMETMVTFIKASTHLMDTINRKMRAEGKCEAECRAAATVPEVVVTPSTPETTTRDLPPPDSPEESRAEIPNAEEATAGGDSDVAGQQQCPCPTEDLLQGMARKLDRAQREIELLQREMLRLHGRRSGPDTAVLYRQIMKGSEQVQRRSSDDDDAVDLMSCICEPESPSAHQVSTIWPPAAFTPRRVADYPASPPSAVGGYQSGSPYQARYYQDTGSGGTPQRRFAGGAGRGGVPRDFRNYGDSPSPIRRTTNNASCMMRLAVYQDFMRGRDPSGAYGPPDRFRSLASSTAPSAGLGEEPRCDPCGSSILD